MAGVSLFADVSDGGCKNGACLIKGGELVTGKSLRRNFAGETKLGGGSKAGQAATTLSGLENILR